MTSDDGHDQRVPVQGFFGDAVEGDEWIIFGLNYEQWDGNLRMKRQMRKGEGRCEESYPFQCTYTTTIFVVIGSRWIIPYFGSAMGVKLGDRRALCVISTRSIDMKIEQCREEEGKEDRVNQRWVNVRMCSKKSRMILSENGLVYGCEVSVDDIAKNKRFLGMRKGKKGRTIIAVLSGA